VSGPGSLSRTRVLVATALALVLVAVSLGWALTRSADPVEVDPAADLTTAGIVVRDTTTGRLAVLRPDGTRAQTATSCARVFTTATRAVCLRPDEAAPGTFALDVLDAGLRVERSLPVNGVPTRARLSADGRMVAWTVFVSGDSYTASGFSTRTGILDLGTGVLISSLEEFALTDAAGRPRTLPADANFWGLSFAADDNTFYATMATGPHFYLVRGDVAAETVTVLTDGVECPSLSPDGSRLVYKRRLPDLSWRLEVYDLATARRTPLAEPGTVDDQGTWLDEGTVAYGRLDEATGAVGLWSVPADGSGAPTRLAADAESPSAPR